jgi:hypothetical protein
VGVFCRLVLARSVGETDGLDKQQKPLIYFSHEVLLYIIPSTAPFPTFCFFFFTLTRLQEKDQDKRTGQNGLYQALLQ